MYGGERDVHVTNWIYKHRSLPRDLTVNARGNIKKNQETTIPMLYSCNAPSK